MPDALPITETTMLKHRMELKALSSIRKNYPLTSSFPAP